MPVESFGGRFSEDGRTWCQPQLPCAPAARPRVSCNQASLRKSPPQGVTIPNADAEKDGSIGIAPRIFEKKTANPKPVSREDILATQDVYDKIISIENFPFNDINLFKST